MSRPIRGIRAELDRARAKLRKAEQEVTREAAESARRLGVLRMKTVVAELSHELLCAELKERAERFAGMPELPDGWFWTSRRHAEHISGHEVRLDDGELTIENCECIEIGVDADVVRAVLRAEEIDR